MTDEPTPEFKELLARSSLGTPDAIAARDQGRAHLRQWADKDLKHELGQVAAERDQLRAALIELVEASRGLAFFDQIKCNRWNLAYTQARQIAGMEDEQ
jgi:hypothetical protein